MKQKNKYNVPFYADKIDAALSAQNAVHAERRTQTKISKEVKKSPPYQAYAILAAPLLLIGAVMLIAPKQTLGALWVLALVGLTALLGSALKSKSD